MADHAADCGANYADPDGVPNPKRCDCHEVARLRVIRDLAADALAELDAQPELAHPDAVWYTGGALRAALEADRG